MTNLEKVKQSLKDTNASLVVLKNNKIQTYHNDGIKDLIMLLSEDKEALTNTIIADKIIGKVAASIMIKAGVKEIYTEMISEFAVEILEEHNIKFEYNKKIPFIENRTKTGMCPMESKFKDEIDLNIIWNEYIR